MAHVCCFLDLVTTKEQGGGYFGRFIGLCSLECSCRARDLVKIIRDLILDISIEFSWSFVVSFDLIFQLQQSLSRVVCLFFFQLPLVVLIALISRGLLNTLV